MCDGFRGIWTLRPCLSHSHSTFAGTDSFAARAGRTFSTVFGAQQSLLEAFVMKRKLMGPSWVVLSNAAAPATKVRAFRRRRGGRR